MIANAVAGSLVGVSVLAAGILLFASDGQSDAFVKANQSLDLLELNKDSWRPPFAEFKATIDAWPTADWARPMKKAIILLARDTLKDGLAKLRKTTAESFATLSTLDPAYTVKEQEILKKRFTYIYLELELSWGEYERLLEAMVKSATSW